MKRLTLLLLVGIALSCNNNGTASKDAIKDSAATTPASSTAKDYPYTIEHPDNWEIGSTANTMTALKGLKAYEEGNIDEMIKYFGDSIRVQFDGMDKKMSNDNLKVMLTNAWSRYKTVHFKMNDWESVVSKDKSEEWVTLWYRHSWETKNGVKDSLDVITDLKLKDGKIIRLADYSRQLY